LPRHRTCDDLAWSRRSRLAQKYPANQPAFILGKPDQALSAAISRWRRRSPQKPKSFRFISC